MPTSKRWRDLRREIGALRRQFLPSSFNPLGVYSNSSRVQAHTRAFLVLSHAEIESYLEGWAKDIVRTSETAWNVSGKINEPLGFLLLTIAERVTVPFDPRSKDSAQRLAEVLSMLFQKHYKQINDNNGIKEKNLLTLFTPIGLSAVALGSTLLPNLEYFGKLRGTHSHHSAQAVLSVLDPMTEHNRVMTLLGDLLVFDQWLANYKRRIR